MIKIYYALFLICACNSLCAMINDIPIVKLPSQKEIASRLNALKLQDFVTKTKIDHELGDHKENVLSINCAIVCALYKYEDAPSTKQINIILAQQKKPEIIAAILKGHPEAIQYLEEAEKTAIKLMLEARKNKKAT